MTFDRIYNQTYKERIHQIHRELRTFRHCTRNDCRTSCAENSLKNQEAFGRKSVGIVIERKIAEVRHAYKSCTVTPEHESKTDKPKQYGTYHKVHKILKQDICRVLTTRETRLAKCETWLHEEYQHRRQQHPYSINGNR